LLRQRKVSKRKAARLPLASCVPRFRRGLPEGPSLALCQRAASLPHPSRAIPGESSGTRRGKRDSVRTTGRFSSLLHGTHCLQQYLKARIPAGIAGIQNTGM